MRIKTKNVIGWIMVGSIILPLLTYLGYLVGQMITSWLEPIIAIVIAAYIVLAIYLATEI